MTCHTVSEFPCLPVKGGKTCTTAVAGRIQHFLGKWKQLTHDPSILSAVKGYKIEFYLSPVQFTPPRAINFSAQEAANVNAQISKFLEKGIIIKSSHEEGEFISNIFLRPKKDGSFRMILNLKDLNNFVCFHHFKMDSIHTCSQLMRPHCYMASIDLRDAYYSVPIALEHQKYLKFIWQGTLYQFTCLAQGLSSAPRLFTKLMKPVFSYLRELGHISSGYLDDSFLLGYSPDECQANIDDTLTLYRDLGFLPHEVKSVTIPTKVLHHLGFVLNSMDMTVSISAEKHQKLKLTAQKILDNPSPTIREVAQLIGTMVSCFPGVEYGELFYRQLEIEKAEALKIHSWDFEQTMHLSSIARSDISWWIRNALSSKKRIDHGKISHTLYTDASTQGWGASLSDITTGGRWTSSEQSQHINYLELKAILLGLQSLCKEVTHAHLRVMTDNTTAVAYVRNMGGSHSLLCNNIAREIWEWCIPRNIWISVSHIPGEFNVIADQASRVFDDSTEWKLNVDVFNRIVKLLGTPTIDMFASRLNHQLTPYVSWLPDPQAMAIDAFTLDWANYFLYAFPPFSILPQVLQKLEIDQAQAILIAPNWLTQPWYPKLTRLLIQKPLLLPQHLSNVHLPFAPEQSHPLGRRLRLIACHLSGNLSRVEEFRKQLKTQSSTLGGQGPKNNTGSTWRSGSHMRIRGLWIPFTHL